MDEQRVLVIGDLHISDRYNGKHKDYLENCFDVLNMITESIKEKEVTHLIALGDWIGIGLNEKNLRKRETLLRVIQVLQEWNKLTNNNVYSLRGNHDIGSKLTDFDMFVELGLLKNVRQLDINIARFHMFDYGEETRRIDVDENMYNIGLFHTNLLIEGETTWYRGGVGTELSTLENLYGVDFAIAGHIHNPSLRIVSTSIRDRDITLFYPGNLTRPKYEPNIWDKGYAVLFKIDDMGTSADMVTYVLKPVEEVFVTTFDEAEEEMEEMRETFDIEALSQILEELKTFNISGGMDYHSQIKQVAGIDREASDLALKYLEVIEEEFKSR